MMFLRRWFNASNRIFGAAALAVKLLGLPHRLRYWDKGTPQRRLDRRRQNHRRTVRRGPNHYQFRLPQKNAENLGALCVLSWLDKSLP
ncbi:MAG: hypothetical protein HZA91_20030 [Verrucomicrobia bacterium]|nr:hypothetical protein [Verrucomicrobiota bacterium]